MSETDPALAATPEPGSEDAAPERGAETGGVAMLEHGLWRRLSAATATEDAAKAWVPLMYATAEGAEACAVFLADPDGGRLRTAANWPEARLPGEALLTAAETAVAQDRGVVRGALPEGDAAPQTGGLVSVAAPLSVDGSVPGAVGLELRPRSRPELRAAMRRLQWGAAWMRDALRADRARAQADGYSRAVQALNTVVGVAEQEDFPTAARAAATDLATRFDCDRVSIGFRRLGRCRVTAISHSAQFGKQMDLVRRLGAAMDEAVDQRGALIHPPDAAQEPMAAHRHAKLAEAHGVGNILTVPLYAVDRFVGAAVFERAKDRPFTQDDADMLEAVATVLAPVLDEKRRNDRWLATKAVEVAGAHFARLVGPGRLGRKAALVAAAVLGAFFWLATGEDRVAADAVVEGAVERTLAAPRDGYIADATVRPGDMVGAGQLLVRLDDRDLALERLRLMTELQRHRIEYDRALAAGDRAETSIRRTQIAQSEAEIELLEKQLDRSRLAAPFDGLVTSGDLSQSIGAAVGRGETLLTIAPAGQYRVALRVDERRIADIETGQSGSLLATALPERSFPLTVKKITPVAEYGEGATTFRVEAALAEPAPALRPGMEGVAKIDVAERRLVTIWTRPMLDWLRIWSWRWLNPD